MNQLTAHSYPEIYKELDIDIGDLGCIMLDTDPLPDLGGIIQEHDLYYSDNLKYVQGFVGRQTPHATLRYGLLPGVKKKHVNAVLQDWNPKDVKIQNVGTFPSVYPDEPYVCIVAHLDLNYGGAHSLKQANENLSLLPNVNTFSGYKAHLTIAYVKKSANVHFLTTMLDLKLQNKLVKSEGINYGDNVQ